MCKPPDQFNLTPRKTYRYLCKVCDIEREKAKVLYEETKQKLEEQQQYQKQLSEKDYTVYHCPYENCNMLNIVYNNEINCGIFRCGYDKSTNRQIPQHTSKVEYDILRNIINNDSISIINDLYVEFHDWAMSSENKSTTNELLKVISDKGVNIKIWI
jgi:hypothetical protein